ncbi:MAG: type II toxin-antitoxin system RelE/ParE family toxin [Patescibacteria group bacterium]
MHWDLIVDGSVQKALKRISRSDAKRLYAVIREFAVNPFSGDIEKMEGEKNTWRRRVGAYRIIYDILKGRRIVHISDIRRRTSSTY